MESGDGAKKLDGPGFWWIIWRMAGQRSSRGRAAQALWKWMRPAAVLAAWLAAIAASAALAWSAGDYGLGWLGAAADAGWRFAGGREKPNVAWIARLDKFDEVRWSQALEAAGFDPLSDDERLEFRKAKARDGAWPVRARVIGRIEEERGQWEDDLGRQSSRMASEVLVGGALRGDDWPKVSRALAAGHVVAMNDKRRSALALVAASSRREYSTGEALSAFAPWARWAPTLEQRALTEESLGRHVLSGLIAWVLGCVAIVAVALALLRAREGCLSLAAGDRESMAAQWEARQLGKQARKLDGRGKRGRGRL